ncbi:MAG: hypothetical protein DWC07_00555 [Candidatus Poseidoniales archaeon]|nr:MAG: hypothetical protein DWC07_00555 [Candidatus Poseidoniales archaeon]
MEPQKQGRLLVGIGALLVAQTFLDIAPEGPWSSASFSRGMLGLSGLICLYLGWFTLTFGRMGVAPTVDLWDRPGTTWLNIVIFGLACLVMARFMGWAETEVVPEPAGLLVGLIGILAVANGLYVWLVVNGPLREEE